MDYYNAVNIIYKVNFKFSGVGTPTLYFTGRTMDLNLLTPEVEKILKEKGYRLMSMKFVNEGKDRYLRVIVDKYHHTVSLDEIVAISEAIDTLLDEDTEENAFILDVTTTGAEKEISVHELQDYVETYIEITMKDGVKGQPHMKGTLSSVNEDTIMLTINERGKLKKVNYSLSDIKLIKRAIKF